MKIKFIQPHSKEWFDAKCGAFSSSQCIRLLKGGTRQMTKAEIEAKKIQDKKDKAAGIETNSRRTVDTIFGAAAFTYINEKVAEIINKKAKESKVTEIMQRGLDLEPEALELYTKITGRVIQDSGLFRLNPFAVGTPDGHYGKRKIIGIVEIKCLNQDNHSEICEMETVEQLRAYDESFYAQCQMNILITGARWADFLSYDNRPMGYNDRGELDGDYFPDNWPLCIKIIRINRDEPFIEDLKIRLDAAAGIMIEKLEKRIKSANKLKRRFERRKIA